MGFKPIYKYTVNYCDVCNYSLLKTVPCCPHTDEEDKKMHMYMYMYNTRTHVKLVVCVHIHAMYMYALIPWILP